MSVYVVLLLLLVSGTQADRGQFAGTHEVHDEAHIKQHLENKIEVEKLSEEQQRFHYFSMHDLNKDQYIDGIEIVKALTHDHENESGPGIRIDDEENIVTMVDGVLKDLDINGDGLIDYAEYSRKQKST
ncbi:unnamed protein product [Auanema sp. JU1783]|nr:unnamed protein product [Auanema sp. JU1783]